MRAWPAPDGLSVYFLDVTERRAAEERARASAARLALIAEASAVTAYVTSYSPAEPSECSMRSA